MNQTIINEVKEFIQNNYQEGEKNINMSVTYQQPIGPQGCQALAQHLNWPIESLNLSMYNIKDEGMQVILKKGKQWPTLKELRVEKNQITCEGLQNLSECEWNELEKLILNKNKIRAKGFAEIIKCKWPKLKYFELNYSEIGPGGTELLGQINWPQLYLINLNYNLIGNEGLRQLSKCKFDELKILNLSNNKIDGKGIFYLSKMNLPNVRAVNLNRNEIGREDGKLSEIGCVYLSHSRMRNLNSIHLFGNDITLNGIKQVMGSQIMRKGTYLQLIRNLFTFSEIKEDLEKYGYECNFFT